MGFFSTGARKTLLRTVLISQFLSSTALAQQGKDQVGVLAISGGLGIGAHSIPSLTDYINSVAQPAIYDRIDDFNGLPEFFLLSEIRLKETWSITFGYSFFLRSFSVVHRGGFGRSDFQYYLHSPNVGIYYVIPDERYQLKLGGGIGYLFSKVDQSLLGMGSTGSMISSGIHTRVDAIGETQFDESFYGVIGLGLMWGFGSEFKDNSNTTVSLAGRTPRLIFFTLNLRFGVKVVLVNRK